MARPPTGNEDIRYVYRRLVSEGRIGGRRERVPVMVTLGVRANGDRVVLDLRLVGAASAASWTEVVASLVGRHLARPVLAVIDGNPGLSSALQSQLAGHRDSTLYGSQAEKLAGEAAGARARRAD